MDVTREMLTGAIRLVNSCELSPRIDHIRKMLAAQNCTTEIVDKVLSDLESYPDWTARKDLDAGA